MKLPSAVWRYLSGVAIIGAAALVGSWLVPLEDRPLSLPLMALFAALLWLAETSPEHVLRGTKLSLGTIPIFAAVLLLPLGAAVTALVIGMLLAQIMRRCMWFEMLFNSAQLAVAACLGGVIYLALGGGHVLTSVPAAVASAAALYVVGVSIVAGIVSAQHGLGYVRFWRQMMTAEARQQLLMYALGGCLAILAAWAGPWGVVAALFTLAGYLLARRWQWAGPGLRHTPG